MYCSCHSNFIYQIYFIVKLQNKKRHFRFLMNEPYIDSSGPSLGALTIFIKTSAGENDAVMKPVWRLYNHQGPDWQYAQAFIPENAELVNQLNIKNFELYSYP